MCRDALLNQIAGAETSLRSLRLPWGSVTGDSVAILAWFNKILSGSILIPNYSALRFITSKFVAPHLNESRAAKPKFSCPKITLNNLAEPQGNPVEPEGVKCPRQDRQYLFWTKRRTIFAVTLYTIFVILYPNCGFNFCQKYFQRSRIQNLFEVLLHKFSRRSKLAP